MGNNTQHLERRDSMGWLLLLSLQEPRLPDESLHLTFFIILLKLCRFFLSEAALWDAVPFPALQK